MGRGIGAPHRKGFRHEVRLACQVVRERDFRVIAQRMVDLSPAGMQVATEARVLTGEAVIVSFRAPRSGAWVDAVGTVARVVHGRRPGERGRGLGIAFDEIEEDAKKLLFGELKAVRASGAGRGAGARRRGVEPAS
jgi:c-di-GMP-binding flagellar brake protein YcgR